MTKNTPIISIIIPVYNVEKYVIRCLDSVLNQEFEYDYEVIVVEDCSTDSSLNILKEYQNIHSNFHLITHKTNQKLSVARRTGMTAAKGEYVMHVDSDDWLLPGALTGICYWLNKHEVDILVFNYKLEDSFGNSRLINNIKKKVLTSDKKILAEYFLGTCWNKVIKRSVFQGMIYGNVSINSQEDLIYSFEILMKAKNILTIPNHYYAYFSNESSLTRMTKPLDYLKLQIVVLEEIKKIFQKYDTHHDLQAIVYNYIQKFIFDLLTKMHFLKVSIDPIFLITWINEIRNKQILTESIISRLKLAISNKWFCLWQEKIFWGYKMVVSICWQALSKGKAKIFL
jgi:glycosyltransferase involved in cell wall biosynthesis